MADDLEPVDPSASGEVSRIIPINIEEEMKTAYIDYSMSVIVSRAIARCKRWLKTSSQKSIIWYATI
jgi:DNA gyrase subunit A